MNTLECARADLPGLARAMRVDNRAGLAAMGNRAGLARVTGQVSRGEEVISIDVSRLGKGIYTISIEGEGLGLRFVRM